MFNILLAVVDLAPVTDGANELKTVVLDAAELGVMGALALYAAWHFGKYVFLLFKDYADEKYGKR